MFVSNVQMQIKERLRQPTLAQEPNAVRITVKGLPAEGILGVEYTPFNFTQEQSKFQRDRANSSKLGFDPSKTGGTGFPLLLKKSRVRLIATVESLRAAGYTRCWCRIRTTYTKNGSTTAALDLTFRKEGSDPDVLSDEILRFLADSYVDQLELYANPTPEGTRIDSLSCVLGAPPKGGDADDPGMHILYADKTYEVRDLLPDEEDDGVLRRTDRAERRNHENATVPNPFAAGSERTPLIAAQSIGTVGTNLGDLLRAKLGDNK